MNYRALLWLSSGSAVCRPMCTRQIYPVFFMATWSLPPSLLDNSEYLGLWNSRLTSWACCQSLHKALALDFPLGGWPAMLLVGIPVSLMGGHGGGCLWGWGVGVRIGVSTCIHMQVPLQSRRETGGKGRRESWLFLCCHVQDYKFEFSLPGYY